MVHILIHAFSSEIALSLNEKPNNKGWKGDCKAYIAMQKTKSSSGRLIEQDYSDLQNNTAGYQDFI